LLPGAGPDLIAEVVAAYRRCSVADAGSVAAFPGVPELLDELRARGVRLGLATSKSMEVAEPVLESLGLRGHFVVAEGTRSDELGTAKEIVVGRALAGLAPDVPVGLVGDRRHDIEGAHAHGIAGFGVLWGYGGREELEAAGADALIAEPADVAALMV
jgi:phosphoglycolate phosphatase